MANSILRGCKPFKPIYGQMSSREVLAVNLRRYRKLRGLSQEDLAHEADIDRTYVSALERCIYAASVDMLDKLAAVLKVRPSDLIADGK